MLGDTRSLTVKGHGRRGPQFDDGLRGKWIELAVRERLGHWEFGGALDMQHAPVGAGWDVGVVSGVACGQAARPSPGRDMASGSIPGSGAAVRVVRSHSPVELHALRANPGGGLLDQRREVHLGGRVRIAFGDN